MYSFEAYKTLAPERPCPPAQDLSWLYLLRKLLVFSSLYCILHRATVPFKAYQKRTRWSSTLQVSGRWTYVISPTSGNKIVNDPNFHLFSSILCLGKDSTIFFCWQGVRRGCGLTQHPSHWLSLSTALSRSISWCYIHSCCTAGRHQNVQGVLNHSENIFVKDTDIFLMLGSLNHPQHED